MSKKHDICIKRIINYFISLMAFVSRADRNLVIGSKDMSNLGPGAYLGHADIKTKFAYIPFRLHSQEPRTVFDQVGPQLHLR